MSRFLAFSTFSLAAVLAAGCAANPADDKVRVTASDPKPTADNPAPAVNSGPIPGATVSATSGPAAAPGSSTPAAAQVSGTATASTATPHNVPAGALAIDANASKIDFEGSKVTGSHKGGFKSFSGYAEPGADSTTLKRVAVEIDMNSTWSDNEKLTGHLKAADFFDVAKYPKAVFESTEIKSGGAKGATHTVTGNLTLHGVTKSIDIPATITLKNGGMDLHSEFALNRKDFAINYPGMANDAIRHEVVIRIDVKAPGKG